MSGINIRQRNIHYERNKKSDHPGTITEKNGLKYNKEDQLDKSRLFKTAIITILMSVFMGYFFIKTFNLLWNVIVNYYLLHQEIDGKSFAKEAVVLSVKAVIAAFIIIFLNKKLLLTYDDEEDLSKYN